MNSALQHRKFLLPLYRIIKGGLSLAVLQPMGKGLCKDQSVWTGLLAFQTPIAVLGHSSLLYRNSIASAEAPPNCAGYLQILFCQTRLNITKSGKKTTRMHCPGMKYLRRTILHGNMLMI